MVFGPELAHIAQHKRHPARGIEIGCLGARQLQHRRRAVEPNHIPALVGKIERREFPKIDSLLFEIDAFSDAVAGRAAYPITPDEMVNTIAGFEAIIQSMNTGKPVSISN